MMGERQLTPEQFIELMRLFRTSPKRVKYVEPMFDMRTGYCFTIRLRCYLEKWIRFHYGESDESLYDRITEWLIGGSCD